MRRRAGVGCAAQRRLADLARRVGGREQRSSRRAGGQTQRIRQGRRWGSGVTNLRYTVRRRAAARRGVTGLLHVVELLRLLGAQSVGLDLFLKCCRGSSQTLTLAKRMPRCAVQVPVCTAMPPKAAAPHGAGLKVIGTGLGRTGCATRWADEFLRSSLAPRAVPHLSRRLSKSCTARRRTTVRPPFAQCGRCGGGGRLEAGGAARRSSAASVCRALQLFLCCTSLAHSCK